MKSIFNKTDRDELIARIQSLDATNTAHWGKMSVQQMVKHTRMWEEMVHGTRPCKRIFLGRILGKMALKGSVKDDTPIIQHAVTSPELVVTGHDIEFEAEKKKWIGLLEAYATFSNRDFIHPFFGKMTEEQIGYFAYKHSDHHLRQFGA